jgi:hypothetical protein
MEQRLVDRIAHSRRPGQPHHRQRQPFTQHRNMARLGQGEGMALHLRHVARQQRQQRQQRRIVTGS